MEHLYAIQDYWDQRANGFSAAVEEELATDVCQDRTAFFKTHLPQQRSHILDVGTGAGFFPVILFRLGHSVTAIDYSDQMVCMAKKRVQALGVSTDVLKMDAQNLQFDDCSFDAVVSRNVLWNLDAPELAYREIARVLRPGGTVIMDDANMYLHLHDADYAAVREEMLQSSQAKESLHSKYNTEHVDFSIIEDIAEELPMSSTHRPVWDFQQLVQLHFTDIHITIRGDRLPMGFRIAAKKRRT